MEKFEKFMEAKFGENWVGGAILFILFGMMAALIVIMDAVGIIELRM